MGLISIYDGDDDANDDDDDDVDVNGSMHNYSFVVKYLKSFVEL